ncbi:GDSL-type esterase/lipase family protein [Anaeromusa sp.]|uniref:GDSL-type esterase/lipase family protein n=1 Tax=Anaeromusa sp. TaxID=1872520 RepID=UPI002612E7D3|nr:GDSL-type esterase/lipase family protein [Anaeromusa sp.]MDD3157656.1 GDSL-type esterase/lipase family protein [Anaeromusa sp.]
MIVIADTYNSKLAAAQAAESLAAARTASGTAVTSAATAQTAASTATAAAATTTAARDTAVTARDEAVAAKDLAVPAASAASAAAATAVEKAWYLSYFNQSKNLFDKRTMLTDTGFDGTTGTKAMAGFCTSDYMPVTPNTQYTRTVAANLIWYAIDKTYLATGSSTDLTVTSPANAYWARVAFATTNAATYQFEAGASATAYVAGGLDLPMLSLRKGNIVDPLQDGQLYRLPITVADRNAITINLASLVVRQEKSFLVKTEDNQYTVAVGADISLASVLTGIFVVVWHKSTNALAVYPYNQLPSYPYGILATYDYTYRRLTSPFPGLINIIYDTTYIADSNSYGFNHPARINRSTDLPEITSEKTGVGGVYFNPIQLIQQKYQKNLVSDPWLTKMNWPSMSSTLKLARGPQGMPVNCSAAYITGANTGGQIYIDISSLGLAAGEELTAFAVIKSDVANQAKLVCGSWNRNTSTNVDGKTYGSRVTATTDPEVVHCVFPLAASGTITDVFFGLSNSTISGSPTSYITGLHLYRGRVKAPAAFESIMYEQLAPDVQKRIMDSNPCSRIMDLFDQPTKKVKVKLLGDSITAGVGGTGYALSTDLAYGGYYQPVRTSTSWANMLLDRIVGQFGHDQYLAANNPNIQITAPMTAANLSHSSGDTGLSAITYNLNGLYPGLGVKCEFYGDHCSVYYTTISNGGIVNVLIDGVQQGTIDTYAATSTKGNEYAITGLTAAKHTLEIQHTNTKNASSTGVYFCFNGVKTPKTITVQNFGVSGQTTKGIYENRATALASDDDLVLIQIGTNDRNSESYPEITKAFLREIIKQAQVNGSQVLLMSTIPSSVASDTLEGRLWHVDDLDTLTRQVAKEFSLPFISNYDCFFRYARETGCTIDDLLSDGLHPNDLGYQVIYENICRHLGLSLIRPGIGDTV